MKKILKIFAITIMLIILFISGTILINSWIKPNEVPSFFGWKPFIVLSGSMETQIFAGDVAVVKEVDTNSLKKGDVIAFKNEKIVITHRIEDIVNEDGQTKYITKGDNNNTIDNGYVKPEQVEGLFCFKISRLGNLAMFIQTPIGMIVCVSIPLIILVFMQMSESRRDREYIEEKFKKEKEMQEEIQKLRKQNEELSKK